jgi:5-methylcytosine-specific restriction enzyme B
MREDIKEILIEFFNQVERKDQSTSHYPSNYGGLHLKVSFGFGKDAKIPWICFLSPGQMPENGIFPVFYFFKEQHKLILAYGISEKNKPSFRWDVNSSMQTIDRYFKSYGITPYKYGLSYVFKEYSTIKALEFEKIEVDLDSLIEKYRSIMKTHVVR